MSYKTSLLKIAIKLTPDILIIWVANMILKGIAKLTDFSFDIDARTVFVQVQLLGEAETIDVWVDGFAIISDDRSHRFIIHKAQSNRLWLNNLLARFTGKAWKIPVIPQLTAQIELISELLAQNPE